ncbi:MAG: hypothetical protein Q9208_002121 [Pyrenodesmia sp. 3 TL-2023]
MASSGQPTLADLLEENRALRRREKQLELLREELQEQRDEALRALEEAVLSLAGSRSKDLDELAEQLQEAKTLPSDLQQRLGVLQDRCKSTRKQPTSELKTNVIQGHLDQPETPQSHKLLQDAPGVRFEGPLEMGQSVNVQASKEKRRPGVLCPKTFYGLQRLLDESSINPPSASISLHPRELNSCKRKAELLSPVDDSNAPGAKKVKDISPTTWTPASSDNKVVSPSKMPPKIEEISASPSGHAKTDPTLGS